MMVYLRILFDIATTLCTLCCRSVGSDRSHSPLLGLWFGVRIRVRVKVRVRARVRNTCHAPRTCFSPQK